MRGELVISCILGLQSESLTDLFLEAATKPYYPYHLEEVNRSVSLDECCSKLSIGGPRKGWAGTLIGPTRNILVVQGWADKGLTSLPGVDAWNLA